MNSIMESIKLQLMYGIPTYIEIEYELEESTNN